MFFVSLMVVVVCDADRCLANWFVPLFSNMSFPPYVVVRIWDWLFVDGVDVLLFITVALLAMLESKLLQCRDFGECHSFLTASDFQRMIPGRTMFQLLSDALDLHTGMGTRVKKWRVEAIHSVVSETENYHATAAVRALAAQTDGISEDDVKGLYDKFKSLGVQARSGQADESLKLKTAPKGKAAVVFEARRLDRTGFKVVISELLPELTAQMNAQALEALFLAFDWDGDGEISFEEMLLTIGMLRGGSTDSRLQFCFQMCATEGRVAVADLTRLFKLCYMLYYPSLPREQLPCVVEALVATIVRTQHDEVGLTFDQFCAVARRHPFVLDCFSLAPDEQGAKLRLNITSGRMVDKAGWVELTKSQSDESWERRFISVRDSSALVFHAAEPHSHTSTEAAAEETLDIKGLRVREPTYARLYHPHSLRLAMVDAGHEQKLGVIDCGSAQEKLAWVMCFSCHGADVATDLLEAGKMLLMQRQQRATATSTAQLDASDNANPLADSVTHVPTASARRRMRTSLFFKAGPLQLLSQGWVTTWAVLSHGLLIVYDSEAGSGAGVEHELKRCNLGDNVRSITFVPVGGGEDRRSSLISIVIGEGDASDVTRLSAGSEATAAEWCSSLRAQAHLDDEDE